MNPVAPAIRLSPRMILLIVLLYTTALVPNVAAKYSYNTLTLALSDVGFLILLAADLYLWRVDPSETVDSSVRVGIALGLLWVAEISINNFLAPGIPDRDVIDNMFWGIIAASIFIYAILRTVRSGRFVEGMTAGVWSGSVSGVLACCMALSLIVFGMGWITRDPLNIAEWAASGINGRTLSMAAYFAYETFAGAFLHLVVLGLLMGLLLGVFGGAVGKAVLLAGKWTQRTL
jgi:hypothetical protein